MLAQEMTARGVSVRTVAGQLGVDESTLRYRLARPPDAVDGRRARATALDGWADVVRAVLERFGDERVTSGTRARCSAQVVHGVLVREFGFAGSYQAVRRYLVRQYGAPPVQAVRRVETPPGVQAQHDWFDWPAQLAGERCVLHGLIGTLSHSRATFVWASRVETQVAWQTGHLAIFQRYGGVPGWVRIDNLKTGVAQGAGPTAVFNPAFVAFARTCGFALDACRPATGSDKGKTERQVRTRRGAFADLFVQAWPSLEALQAALDARAAALHAQLRCPVTGTTIAEAFAAEQRLLRPVPALHEPFDVVVARRVSRDCLVSFEGRRYSVPFVWVHRLVEVRGTARHVVVLAEGAEIARHARHTTARLVLDPAHYEGESTATVTAPTPFGRRARQQLANLPGWPAPATVARPLDAYVQLIEVGRP
ncbi:MAG: IS21 family transposase [Gemmatimonadaceae bacterium]